MSKQSLHAQTSHDKCKTQHQHNLTYKCVFLLLMRKLHTIMRSISVNMPRVKTGVRVF